jgi:uncharacterized damage-inducible protein DinB
MRNPGKDVAPRITTKEEQMPAIDTILMEMEQEAAATRRLLERVPEDKLTWKPHPKSWSLGQLALHVAGIPGGVSAIAALDVYEAPGFEQQEAASRDQLLQTFEQGLMAAREVLRRMDDERLAATWTLRDKGRTLMAVPRAGIIRTILLNHYYHHRGQLTVYLRLLNVPIPSVYGPSADENPFAEMSMAAVPAS